jgi:hypothetical protein
VPHAAQRVDLATLATQNRVFLFGALQNQIAFRFHGVLALTRRARRPSLRSRVCVGGDDELFCAQYGVF